MEGGIGALFESIQAYQSVLMQRRRAKAIAIAQTEVIKTRMVLAAGMLLLPAALLLLLISP